MCYVIFTMPARMTEPQSNYVMTSVLTPLSVILKENYEEIIVNDDLKEECKVINSITPIDSVIQTTIYTNLP